MSNANFDLNLFCDLTGEHIFFKPRSHKGYVLASDNHTIIAIANTDYVGEEYQSDDYFEHWNDLAVSVTEKLQGHDYQAIDLDLGEPVDCDYCKGSGHADFHDPLEWCSPPINEKDLELKQNEHYFGGMVVALGGDTRCEVCRGTGKYYGHPKGFGEPGPSIRVLGMLIDKNLLMRVANQPGIQYAITPDETLRERSISFRFGNYYGVIMALREKGKGGDA